MQSSMKKLVGEVEGLPEESTIVDQNLSAIDGLIKERHNAKPIISEPSEEEEDQPIDHNPTVQIEVVSEHSREETPMEQMNSEAYH
jgi:hypothetical protein